MSHECPGDQFEQEASQARLCANGCGFFANPACLDMCSKCYRERAAEDERTAANGKAAAAALSSSRGKADSPVLPLPRPAAVSVPAPEEPTPEAQQAVVEGAAQPAAAAAASSSVPGDGGEEQRPVQKNPGRCFTCNKRVGLTGFKCRCDFVFCSTHRHVYCGYCGIDDLEYAEAHQCGYDYKAAGRELLAKNNPLVQAAKVERL